MQFKTKTALVVGMAMGLGFAGTATAFEPGDWLVRVGASYVSPASDNHEIVDVESGTSATINLTYMMTDVWALELLAAYPFKHDLELADETKIGSTKQLPPTLSIQYHFRPTEKFQPYVGFGINYTTFSSEKTTGPLEGTDLNLGSSWGLAGQIGFDMLLNDKWFLNVDARYIDIDTKASVNGESIGKVEIDPFVFGGHIGFKF
ncbi:OmpW family protein [Pseudomonadota bacterium]